MTRPLNPAFTSLETYAFVRLDQSKAAAGARGLRLFDFSIGDPHEETPAFIRERLVESIPPRSSYPAAAGSSDLREAIADWVRSRFDVALDPEKHVLPANGSKEAVYLIHQAVIDPRGDRRVVLIPDPAYPVYEIGARFAGGEPVSVPLLPERGFLPDLRSLSKDLLARVALLWINYPNNPTGAVASRSFFQEAADLARRHDFWLASDEAYSEIYFDAPPSSALEVGLDHVLTFQTLSKRSAMTGYRSGFMAGDPELIALLRRLRPSQGVATPSFIQAAATAAWRDERHVVEQRRIYREKREALLPALQARRLEVGGSQATFYLWVRTPGNLGSEEFARRLLERGIVVAPGNYFGARGEGWVRFALVPTLAECHEAAAVMSEVEW